MANIREAFEYAAKNPNSQFAKNLEQQASSGALDVEAKKYGIDLTPFKPAPEPVKRSVGEKILDFTGGKEIAQGLGQSLANRQINKQTEQVQSQQFDIQNQLIQRIKEKKALGEDTSRLDQALGLLGQDISQVGQDTGELLNQRGLTGKQVIGDALQLASTASAGSIGGGTLGKGATGSLVRGTAAKTTGGIAGLASGITGGTTGVLRGAAQGALTGAGTGIIEGGLQGAAQGLQNDKDLKGVLGDTAKGSILGGIGGGIVGGLIGGVSGGIQARNLRKDIISAQEQSGLRPSLSDTVKQKIQTSPEFTKFVKEAKKQGYSDSDINFLATVGETDKPTLQKMYDLTVKAQSNPRQITRAADVLGENATGVVKQVQTQNSKAGKLVDQTAKALKGQSFDASPIEQKVLSSLDDVGITIGGDGSIDFSQSVFKNTPKLQKEIERVIRTLPDGSDAYQAHIFKKSVDELVNFGSGGEGLSGKASSLLKSMRTAVDDALDSSFTDYNSANTEYKLTKDFLEEVQSVVGKKVDFSTKEGAQAFGQAFRSAFSNNKSRPKTLALIETLQNVAKQRGLKGAEQNLLDQALYVNMLEEQFGTQASTGLAGEVGKAIEKAKGIGGAVRNPIQAGLGAIADQIEKGQNISPEMKKQLLRTFIQ